MDRKCWKQQRQPAWLALSFNLVLACGGIEPSQARLVNLSIAQRLHVHMQALRV